ncbi:hypothetical protein SAMN05421833_11283 [Microbispora rosea]|uniref:Uncharacterized protein n=1 Tax=Microbispora rosea TaxID=58117 RepID=A0A1N7CMK2_9ACTN|nr:hypothetical protein SAMN05421833_11283 [Microbispora rosea]
MSPISVPPDNRGTAMGKFPEFGMPSPETSPHILRMSEFTHEIR